MWVIESGEEFIMVFSMPGFQIYRTHRTPPQSLSTPVFLSYTLILDWGEKYNKKPPINPHCLGGS
jgi:hypothetical protein